MSLRDFLTKLEEIDELIHVKETVDPRFEVASIIDEIQRTVNKAVLFDRIKGFNIPIVSNILGSQRRVSLSFETKEENILKVWQKREKHLKPTKSVKNGSCKEIILLHEKIDVGKFPLVTHYEKDGGPYITAGIVFANDSEWHTNASFNRIQFN